MFTMTPHIFSNFIHKPATRNYPRTARPPFSDVRGRVVNRIEGCNFCGVCALKCPTACIEVERPLRRWVLYPHICIGCGVCVEVCPRHCLHQESAVGPPSNRKETIVLIGREETPE